MMPAEEGWLSLLLYEVAQTSDLWRSDIFP